MNDMKKIDLHIHTVQTISDSPFKFCINKLREYIHTCKLDAIAITNHNTLDIDQFRQISTSVDIPVFPGIEINIDGGHLLLIAEKSELSDFAIRCSEVTSRISAANDSIKTSELIVIYGDLSKYLLIPHYEKSPQVPSKSLSELAPFIDAGEVNSPKKFVYCLKNSDSLSPVYFSDCRICAELVSYPNRHTFINCGEVTLNAIKSSLRDKTKISLSYNGPSLIQVFEDGQEISTGLTVIIGERSSGKSYTLNRIADASSNPKFIRQFSLVERNEKEDEDKFNTILSRNHSLFTQEYLKEYQSVVNEIIRVDIDMNDRTMSNYLDSLKKHAFEVEKLDAFAKSKLFREEEFPISDLNELKKLIASVQHLIENIEYRAIIDKHINNQKLKLLIIELMNEFGKKEEERLKRIWLNDLIVDIKTKLKIRTAATAISEVDLYKVAIDLEKKSKFTEITNMLRKDQQIMHRDIQGFKIVARKCEFTSVTELKSSTKSRASLKSAYQAYSDPYIFLQEMKNIDGLPESDYYQLFARIQYLILNKDGYEVSGGERSEFNLLREINDAQQYDILLIDEPESSFDNIFLKNDVNKLLKELSQSMPVVLVTHNNTVGASIMPDYILCTKKEVIDGNIEYLIYSGFTTDKTLTSRNNKQVKNIDVTMGCLEAGKTAYGERRRMYEDLEN
ncbi:MAG TPA: phosphotransferase [Spirochaetota bacterium]|nr:phosphotransferase [Spirochaetota bacterium]